LDTSPAEASDPTAADASDATSAYDAGTPDVAEGSSPLQTGPQDCGFTPCAAGASCPDLIVDFGDLNASIVIDTRSFLPTDCALVEGCITTPGTRRLLRFDTAAVNVGTADLTIGDPTTHACFQYSDCHMHYHFKGVGEYTLYQADGATVAARGHKQGFCLEDVEPYTEAPGPPPATFFTCQSQGLHVGWEDVYPNDIDCQWIDITGVAPGSYILSVVINGGHYLPESNYANDEARVPVLIPPP
ncbi:MAG: lysyl oxidase family protein, partial [Polyangiaceae bacterium]